MMLPGFTFNGVTSDSVYLNLLHAKWSMLPDSRDVFEAIPGRPGSWHYPQPPGDRTLTLSVGINATTQSDLHSKVRTIAEWLRPQGRKSLILDEDPSYYWSAVVANPGDIDHLLELGQWDIQFRTDPYVYALTESNGGSPSIGASPTITNTGAIEVPTRIVVYASGTVTNPAVSLGDESFSWTGVLPAGSALVVDSVDMISGTTTNGAAALAGTLDLSTLTVKEITGDFPILDPGGNVLHSSGGTGIVKVFWRQRRL